jgi:hypothetical protein
MIYTPLGLYNKILVGYLLFHLYSYLSPLKLSFHAALHPHPFLLYLIKTHPSDDEQREWQYQ